MLIDNVRYFFFMLSWLEYGIRQASQRAKYLTIRIKASILTRNCRPLTVVCFDELLDEVQPQASASVAPRRAHVNLLKCPKDLPKLVLWDPQTGV